MKRRLFIILLCVISAICLSLGLAACGGKNNPPDNGNNSSGNTDSNGGSENTDNVKLTYDMSGVSFNDATYVYDGTEKSVVISGTLPEGVTVSYTNNKLTEAGTITATATFTGDNTKYNAIPNKTATLTVSKATYDMSGVVFDNLTCTYDGKSHTITASNLPSGVTATYEGGDKTEVGTYIITAHFSGDSKNYDLIPDMQATLTITKATYDMSGISFNNASYPYDSTEKELVILGTLPQGVTVQYTNNKLTNVGSVEATATFTGDSDNYNAIADMKATLTIIDTTVYHTVKFILSDTETVDIKVAHGETVTNSPELPQRAGYSVSWDKTFTNIIEDITVNDYCNIYNIIAPCDY